MKGRERLVYGDDVRSLGDFLNADEVRCERELGMVKGIVGALENGAIEGDDGDIEALRGHVEGMRNEIARIRLARRSLGLSKKMAMQILERRYHEHKTMVNVSLIEGKGGDEKVMERELSILEGLLIREKAGSTNR